MPYRSDWPAVKERWSAFWERQNTDRPLLDITYSRASIPTPMRPSQSAEDIWFDPQYVAQRALEDVETTGYAGEAIPGDGVHVLMAGWALGCGAQVHLAENTIWHSPLFADLDAARAWCPDERDPWRARVEALLRHVLDVAQSQFLVGYPWPMCISDLLPLLRGSEAFLLDLAESPARCSAVLRELLPRWGEVFEHFRGIIQARQEGCFWGWPGMWHPEMVMVTQSDMSCMIGPTAFHEYVEPELDWLGSHYERVWYHLDGPGAVKHLPALLRKPYIVAIQYVPGAGQPDNGPAWLGLYHHVQSSGRCLDLSTTPEHVEFLVRHLRPEGLVIRVRVESQDEAEALLSNAARWCSSPRLARAVL